MNSEQRKNRAESQCWHSGGGQKLRFAWLAYAVVGLLAARTIVGAEDLAPAPPAAKPVAQGAARPQNPLNGQRAFGYLQQICEVGPRISGSPGMTKQQEMLQKHFEALGAKVSLQKFLAPNPLGGDKVPMANMIVEWHPERMDRILLCAHYDTRPLPDQDPDPVQKRQGVFLGANDGGSGVAVLMELGNLMKGLDCRYGVDFVFFDGEELVYVDKRDPYFFGSTWFAQQYVKQPPQYKYRWGALIDMVGDADLQIYQEKNSVAWQDTRPLVMQIWATAGRLGVKEFIPRPKYELRDDHLPLHDIAKIPTCDIIDFEYPVWHTTRDTVQRCSPSSLAKVGWVLYEWLKTVPLANNGTVK